MRSSKICAVVAVSFAATVSFSAGEAAEFSTQKPASSGLILDQPKPRPAPPPPAQPQPTPAAPQPAEAAAPQAQQPLRLLLAKGYEVKNLSVMTLETTKQYAEKATQPGVVLTLQKGASFAVCYFSLFGYMSLHDNVLDSTSNCDVRGTETDVYEFVQSSQASIAMFRLNTLTGEVGYCYYDRKGDQPGMTVCDPPAPEAQGVKEIGPFKLIPHKRDDPSVFRVNLQSGAMSICYPVTENSQTRVWCTNYAR